VASCELPSGESKSCLDPHPESIGCDDTLCLRAVCQVDSTCCSYSYNERCVEIAKNFLGSSCRMSRPTTKAPTVSSTFAPSTRAPQSQEPQDVVSPSPAPYTLPATTATPTTAATPLLPAANSCWEESLTGAGCREKDCETLVCSIQPECCAGASTTSISRRYDSDCVAIAQESCPTLYVYFGSFLDSFFV
jgi:hypothetical protein